MKNLLLAFVFYGLAYYAFEAIFNFVSIDLFSKELTWKQKLRLKVRIAPSFWMIPVGALCGFLIHLYLKIPLNYSNVFILILLGIVSSGIITGLELASGMLLNEKMNLHLWDYSDSEIEIFGKFMPLNFRGQIDVYHSFAWFMIGYLFLAIDRILF